jgi:Protein of unknown function (DUF3237)
MNTYQIEHLFTYRLQVAPPQIIGPVPGDVRLDFAIVGGEITGPRLQGSVKPGGADFGTLRTDGIFLVDVRGALESHDGALIDITYTGVMDLGPDGYGKFLNGEGARQRRCSRRPTFSHGASGLCVDESTAVHLHRSGESRNDGSPVRRVRAQINPAS